MTLSEKASYIKGLADGLDYNKDSAEGKLITALIDITGDLSAALNKVEDNMNTLNDYIEEIDEDLGSVEEYLMGDDDCDCCDCDDDDDDCDCDCDCDCCDCDDDEEYYEVVCPSCGETICFDESVDPENLVCPACNEKFACLCDEEDLKDLNK